MKVKVLFWLKSPCTESLLDKAYENGLTDGDWVKKGGRKFVEFVRDGSSVADVVAQAQTDLTTHGIGHGKPFVLEIDGVWQNVDPR